jgi:hypothetical protein
MEGRKAAVHGFYREGLRNSRNLVKTVADSGCEKAVDILDEFDQQNSGTITNESQSAGKKPSDPPVTGIVTLTGHKSGLPPLDLVGPTNQRLAISFANDLPTPDAATSTDTAFLSRCSLWVAVAGGTIGRCSAY